MVRKSSLLHGKGIKVTDTESYQDLQQSYHAYNKVTKLEMRMV
jgi:hypothetical protein